MKTIVCLLLCAAFTLCASPRIAGGTKSSTGQFPYSVELVSKYADGSYSFCGGSLINKRYVLTAAHCFLEIGAVPLEMYAIMGDTDLNSDNAMVVPVISGVYHPLYNNDTIENDVALAVLSKDVAENDVIQYALLATTKPATNTLLTIAGWGLTSSSQRTPPAQQSYAQLSVVDGSQCTKYFNTFNEQDDLCMFGDNQQPCQGDSGSGLVSRASSTDRYTVSGLVSFGADQCTSRSDSLNAFTNVALYYNFILLNANATSLPAGTASSPTLVAAQLPSASATNPPSDPGTVSGTNGAPAPAGRTTGSASTTIVSMLVIAIAILAYTM